MKFLKLDKQLNFYIDHLGKKINRIDYSPNEYNDIGLSMLENFLTGDLLLGGYKFIDWLKNADKEDATGSNLTALYKEDNEITIRYEWYGAGEFPPTVEEEKIKFVTTVDQLIEIIKRWFLLMPYLESERKDDDWPDSILITEDASKKVYLETIAIDDVRFSALTKDYKQPNAVIEKSDLFDQYYKVRSNNKILYIVGLTLTTYLELKQVLIKWLNDLEDENLYYSNIVKLVKKNDLIYLNNTYDPESMEWTNEFPIPKKDLIKLLDEWELLISKGIERFSLKFENEKILLSSQD